MFCICRCSVFSSVISLLFHFSHNFSSFLQHVGSFPVEKLQFQSAKALIVDLLSGRKSFFYYELSCEMSLEKRRTRKEREQQRSGEPFVEVCWVERSQEMARLLLYVVNR